MAGTAVAEEAKLTRRLSKDLERPAKEGLIIALECPRGNAGLIYLHNPHTFTYVLDGEPLNGAPILENGPLFHLSTALQRGDSPCQQAGNPRE